MKNTKKLLAFLLAGILMITAAACGGPTKPASTAATSGTEAAKTSTEAPSAEAPTTAAPTEAPEPSTEAQTEPHVETPEEFQAALVSFLNMDLLNGFLHSDFDDPRDAVLGEAVMQGSDRDRTVDYKKAYAENGRVYLEGAGVRVVSEEHMIEFLQNAAGITPADIPGAEELYLNGYNAYAAQAGDSNYHPMGILKIDRKEDGTTVVTYKSDSTEEWWVWYTNAKGERDLDYAPIMQLTLGRDEEGNFRVLKNHSLKLAARRFMDEPAVNGFLISAYADARDARLFEVLLMCDEPGLDLPEIMKKHGTTPDSYSGYRAITMEHLRETTKRVTGYDAQELYDSNFIHTAFSSMTAINKIWYPEEQVFITQAGDTNYRHVAIQDFTMDDEGIFTVIYKAADGYHWLFWFANEGMDNIYDADVMVCRMKQDENGDLKLLSNRPYSMKRTSVEEAEIKMFFNHFRLANGMLHSVYTDVRDVNFGEIVYQGYDNVPNATVNEAYAAQGRTRDQYTGFSAVLDEEMEDFLYGVTGYHLEEFKDVNALHFDGYGFYGSEHGDSNYQPVVIDEVILGDDGSIAVYYHSEWGGWGYVQDSQYKTSKQMLAVLERSDDYWYHIISNEAVK